MTAWSFEKKSIIFAQPEKFCYGMYTKY